MNLYRVTMTGADDSVDLQQLVDLSLEFPFVEWGVLLSKSQQGNARFPSEKWIEAFAEVAVLHSLKVAAHICGAWTRQLLKGELNWEELPNILGVAERIQINTHAENLVSTMKMTSNMLELKYKEFIFQWDGVNNHLAFYPAACGLEVSVLYDRSGGAGLLPVEWPRPPERFICGYAGGLGPENIVEQLTKIEIVCRKPFWIDMERWVRSEDGQALDLGRVRRVLNAVKNKVRPA